MSTLKMIFRFAVLSLLFLMVSCVKDVDVDQAQEIVIPPTAALDLVYFTLDPSHFVRERPSGPLIARDEVRLEFLDDDYIRNGLIRADYNFIFTNSFRQSFKSTFIFLSENNVVRYRINFDIPAGSPSSPVTIDYTEIIDIDEIDAIRKSIKMFVILEMQPNSEVIEGELQLKSKAFYRFEFK